MRHITSIAFLLWCSTVLAQTVNTPTCTCSPGTCGSPSQTSQTVTCSIASPPAGAHMCFVRRGLLNEYTNDPQTSSPGTCYSPPLGSGAYTYTYTAPFTESVYETVDIIGTAPGYTNSSKQTYAFKVGVAPVTLSLLPGVYATPQILNATTTTSGATVCCTIDGSLPTSNGAGVCTNGSSTLPISLANSETDVFCLGSKSGWSDSSPLWGTPQTPSTGAQASFGSYYIGTSPVQPQLMIASDITPSNFPCLFPAPVNKTVKASGGDYTKLWAADGSGAWNHLSTDTGGGADCEIITVDPIVAATLGDSVQAKYNQVMLYPLVVWTRTSGTLPAQDTDTRTCTVNSTNYSCPVNPTSDSSQMFTISKTTTSTTYDSGLVICGDAGEYGCTNSPTAPAQGLIITGMNFAWSAPNGTTVPHLLCALCIGDKTDTVAPSRIWIDRSLIHNAYDDWAHGWNQEGIISYGSYVSVADSYIGGVWIPNGATGSFGQSQDFYQFTGAGPVKLFNDWLGGAPTQGVMFGANPYTASLGPVANVEGRRLVITKDSTIINTSLVSPTTCNPTGNQANATMCATVADPHEFKGGISQVLWTGNVEEWSWDDCGNTTCWYPQGANLGVVKDSVDPTWTFARITRTSDILDYGNIYGHGASLQFIGHSQAGGASPSTARVKYSNDIFFDLNYNTYNSRGGTGTGVSGIGFDAGTNTNNLEPMYYANGPGCLDFENIDWFGTPNNLLNLTYMNGQNTTPPGLILPCFTFHSNIVVGDGQFSGPGNMILQGDGGYYPWMQLSAQGSGGSSTLLGADFGSGTVGGAGTGNILFNFYKGSGNSCLSGTGAGAWGSTNPGICPVGVASSPSTINTLLNTGGSGFNYAACSTGTLASCVINGTYATVGAQVSVIQTQQGLAEDAIINGIARMTGPGVTHPSGIQGLFIGLIK